MAFMAVALGAISIAVAVMIGYIVIAQVKATLPADADANITAAMEASQTTIFAGFSLIAVGILVLAAFGLVNVFK